MQLSYTTQIPVSSGSGHKGAFFTASPVHHKQTSHRYARQSLTVQNFKFMKKLGLKKPEFLPDFGLVRLCLPYLIYYKSSPDADYKRDHHMLITISYKPGAPTSKHIFANGWIGTIEELPGSAGFLVESQYVRMGFYHSPQIIHGDTLRLLETVSRISLQACDNW